MRWMGATSLLVLLLTWAALDDITTGAEPSFIGEYTVLVLSGIWFAVTAGWLMRRRSVLGLASLAAVAVGILAFWSLPRRGEPGTVINLLGLIPILWFLALSVWMLLVRGYRWIGATHEPAARAGDFPRPRPCLTPAAVSLTPPKIARHIITVIVILVVLTALAIWLDLGPAVQ